MGLMIRGIWEAFVARLSRNVKTDEGKDDSPFIPSPLDLSIREAHGGQDVRVERELSKVSEQAAEIEKQDRDTS